MSNDEEIKQRIKLGAYEIKARLAEFFEKFDFGANPNKQDEIALSILIEVAADFMAFVFISKNVAPEQVEDVLGYYLNHQRHIFESAMDFYKSLPDSKLQ